MKPLTGPKREAGALLLESLIAILIFSFGLLGLVAIQARATQYSVDAEDRNRAALLANDIVSTMWAQQTVDTGTLADEIAAWQTRVKAALPPYDDTVTATVSSEDGNGVVTIKITWTPASGKSSTARSYVTQAVIP